MSLINQQTAVPCLNWTQDHILPIVLVNVICMSLTYYSCGVYGWFPVSLKGFFSRPLLDFLAVAFWNPRANFFTPVLISSVFPDLKVLVVLMSCVCCRFFPPSCVSPVSCLFHFVCDCPGLQFLCSFTRLFIFTLPFWIRCKFRLICSWKGTFSPNKRN